MSPAIPTVQDLFSLDSKRFIVCGAGQGIGAASARALKALGADLVCVDMEADRAEAIAAEVGGTPLSLDLLTEDGVDRLAAASAEGIDGIVDIIGGATRKSIADLDAASWQKDLDVNIRHAYLLGREFGPRLVARGGGSITFVASIVGTGYGTHVTPSYHASKAALISWTRSVAVTYGPGGVRANTVSPGLVRTPRMEHVWSGTNKFEEVLEKIALKRLQEPEDIANAAAFLATPAAASITGQNIIVDGGITVRDPFYGDSKDETLV
ncbi:MAG: SDR family oxidoreductase [Actinobacteria bacterium]|nr:SDR family oxidoreductase [Actinomycetota bacterium]